MILFLLPTALSEVIANISFGGAGSSRPIHLDNVQCTGTEPNLLNCSHNGIGVHDCNDDHGEDIGIICMRSQGTVTTFGIFFISEC